MDENCGNRRTLKTLTSDILQSAPNKLNSNDLTWIVPSPRVGTRRSHVFLPGPYLETPDATLGQPLGNGGTFETEGTGHVPPVATVTTSAPSATTDQSPIESEWKNCLHLGCGSADKNGTVTPLMRECKLSSSYGHPCQRRGIWDGSLSTAERMTLLFYTGWSSLCLSAFLTVLQLHGHM